MVNIIKRMCQKYEAQDLISKNVIGNMLGGVGIKGLALFVMLFTTPAYIRYFNNNAVLGVWFTLLSVLSWILNFDMGIGNGLRNRLTEVLTLEDNHIKVKKYISSAYYFISFISVIFLTLMILASSFINWNYFFNISETILNRKTLLLSVQIVLASIMVQFVLRLIISILFALQKSAIPRLLSLITNLIMLFYVVIAYRFKITNSFVILSIVYFCAVNFPLIFSSIYVFSKDLRNARPSIKYYDSKFAFDTLKIGFVFLWLQLALMIINTTNNIEISVLFSSAYVVEYQIYNRIFTFIGVFIAMITTPIWSAVTKAKYENNVKWIRTFYRKMIIIAVVSIALQFLLIPILQFIFNIWLGSATIKVNLFYAYIYAISGACLIWVNIITYFANGLEELKIQMIYLTIGAVINIPLAILISKILGSYISVVLANIISYLPYCIAQTIWLNKALKKGYELDNKSNMFLVQ